MTKRETDYGLAKFVMTKDEIGYQEVIDTFSRAKYIYILTYNLSEKDNTLLHELNNAPESTEIKIYTNIPKRFNDYYYNWAKTNARKQIENYVRKLDPENFNNNFSGYFQFNNHSKIIMTDSLAYVGSANYSKESSRSFESGVIFNEKSIIDQIKSIIDEDFHPHSIAIYKYDILPLVYMIAELESISSILCDVVFGIFEFHGREVGRYYRTHDISLSQDNLDQALYVIEKCYKVIEELVEEIEVNESTEELIGNLEVISNTLRDFEFEPETYELVEFDEEGYINAEMNDRAIEMDNESLDEIVSNIQHAAAEIKSELAWAAEESVQRGIEIIEETVSNLLDELSTLKSFINEDIDNTN
ncbi:hypothetical protein MHI04_22320 [Lysinibacillus sp. FSL K6-1151]|uniref:hypothetical protein n=1 Tax=Lysinibacillus sp. FSL K6-1151 TaxID=2921465 RepID=UPI003159B52A